MRANERETLTLLIEAGAPAAARDLMPRCSIISDATALRSALYNLRQEGLIEEVERERDGKATIRLYAPTAAGRAWVEEDERRCAEAAGLEAFLRETQPEAQTADAETTWIRPPDPESELGDYAAMPADDMLDDFQRRVGQVAQAVPATTAAPQVTPIRVAIHRPGQSPIDGDGVTWVEVQDEGAGPYLIISQPTALDRDDHLAFDPDELPLLIEAARILGFST